MKVWISKLAIAKGVFQCETVSEHGGKVRLPEGYFLYIPGKHMHKTKAEAIAKAEEMRIKRIASLKKQIEKLESMKFD